MPDIAVCFKCTRQAEDLRIAPDLTVDVTQARFEVGEYDMRAIEEAVELATQTGGNAIGITFGSMDSKAPILDAGARGLAEVIWVNDATSEKADGYVTSQVLAACLRRIDDLGMVICAEGAADTYAHQVAPRLAAKMSVPLITSVDELETDGSIVRAQRQLKDTRETVETTLPAVIAVNPEVHEATIPGMKAIIAAKKMPLTELSCGQLGLTVDELEPKTSVMPMKGYVAQRKRVIFDEGTTEEKVHALIDALSEEGVI